MAPVTNHFKDKVAAPKLRSGDFVVGAFGSELGKLRNGTYGWYWLDRPSEQYSSRPDAIDTRIRALISQGSLIEDPTFSIRNRERISDAAKMLIRERDKDRCQDCGIDVSDGTRRFDHFVPVAFGGTSAIENVHLLCDACNRKKWHIPPWHFYGENWQAWAPGKPRPDVSSL
ncbi:MAG: hypothetical protein AVDCRST_MAG93-8211 [uncultured Chloroflexia bacterium]|uniref:HNH nuclease domain-containing protein n=1 Tax=uncultured Chloroflexia bacterium TaxID=1672391 RepID=A0A6J4MWS4_9CHLR|nr:MAG: hypothetical protein AVDCRST_MAG93-8211 [uncultured Chloroflexia bacterium]